MMYKALICVIFACMALNVHAQNNTTTVAPTKQPATSASGNVIVSTASGNVIVSTAPGNGSMPTTMAPTPKTTVKGKLKITGVAPETEEKIIKDKSSQEYKNFTTNFCEAVEKIVDNSKCAVTAVTKGSLVVEFTSTFDAANKEAADKAVKDIGDVVKTGSLGKYTTDKESFVGSLSGPHATTTEPTTTKPSKGVNVVSMGTVTLLMATAAVMKALF